MVAKFSRYIDNKIISNLKDTDLWGKKLSADCFKNSNVFLAIRDNYFSFYYNGGRLFRFGSEGFSTNVKYVAFIDKPLEGDIFEKNIFLDGYDRIKENCKKYSADTEAQGVSCIYHKYPYTSDKSNVVVLDIEITAPGDKETRIDILLFNKDLRKLRFIEAKKYDNKEIKSKTKPEVVEQLERYEELIARRNDFLPAYKEHIDTLNKFFSQKLSTPEKMDDKVRLLIFGFDKDQKEGGLDKITKKLNSYNVSCYSIGNIKGISAENLWKKTD